MIRGTLDEFSLPDIVGLVARAGKTGVLELSGPARSGRLYFKEGRVCGARCPAAREPLGRKLVRANVLTDGQLQTALARRGELNMPLGQALVTDGLARREEVDTALREQVEDSIVGVLLSEPVEFTWRSEEPEQTSVAVDAQGFLDAVDERLRELDEIRRRIPSDDLRITLSPVPPPEIASVSLTGEEWRVLALLGARRSIGDLLHYSGSGDLHTLRVIHRLVIGGLLEVPAPAVPPAPQPPVPPMLSGAQVAGRSEVRPRVIRLGPEPPPPGDQAVPLSIAVVSTWDRARGPLVAALLKRHTGGMSVVVSSYATHPVGEASPTAEAIEAAEEYGLGISSHRSWGMVPGGLSVAHLVLGFEWQHLQRAIVQGGAPSRSAFTLPELAGLLERVSVPDVSDPRERARLAVREAHSLRVAQAPPGELEIPPLPAGGAAAPGVRHWLRLIDEMCGRLAEGLLGSGVLGNLR